jgi:hypothetical protein
LKAGLSDLKTVDMFQVQSGFRLFYRQEETRLSRRRAKTPRKRAYDTLGAF